jgi:hypothetical protein
VNLTDKVSDSVTVGLLATLSIVSLVVTNLVAVWAIGGATYGTALTVIIPPIMIIRCLEEQTSQVAGGSAIGCYDVGAGSGHERHWNCQGDSKVSSCV